MHLFRSPQVMKPSAFGAPCLPQSAWYAVTTRVCRNDEEVSNGAATFVRTKRIRTSLISLKLNLNQPFHSYQSHDFNALGWECYSLREVRLHQFGPSLCLFFSCAITSHLIFKNICLSNRLQRYSC